MEIRTDIVSLICTFGVSKNLMKSPSRIFAIKKKIESVSKEFKIWWILSTKWKGLFKGRRCGMIQHCNQKIPEVQLILSKKSHLRPCFLKNEAPLCQNEDITVTLVNVTVQCTSFAAILAFLFYEVNIDVIFNKLETIINFPLRRDGISKYAHQYVLWNCRTVKTKL